MKAYLRTKSKESALFLGGNYSKELIRTPKKGGVISCCHLSRWLMRSFCCLWLQEAKQTREPILMHQTVCARGVLGYYWEAIHHTKLQVKYQYLNHVQTNSSETGQSRAGVVFFFFFYVSVIPISVWTPLLCPAPATYPATLIGITLT